MRVLKKNHFVYCLMLKKDSWRKIFWRFYYILTYILQSRNFTQSAVRSPQSFTGTMQPSIRTREKYIFVFKLIQKCSIFNTVLIKLLRVLVQQRYSNIFTIDKYALENFVIRGKTYTKLLAFGFFSWNTSASDFPVNSSTWFYS